MRKLRLNRPQNITKRESQAQTTNHIEASYKLNIWKFKISGLRQIPIRKLQKMKQNCLRHSQIYK